MYDPTREKEPFEVKLGNRCIKFYAMPIKATILYDKYVKEASSILVNYSKYQEIVKKAEDIPEGQEKTDYINANKKDLEEFAIKANSFAENKDKVIDDILKAILFAAGEEYDKDLWDSLYSVNDKFDIVNNFVDSKKKELLEAMGKKGL